MAMPALVLQKSHAKSKTCDHIACLHRRLALWEKGAIAELLKEGKAIQRNLIMRSVRGGGESVAKTACTGADPEKSKGGCLAY